MKKILALSLAAAMILCAAACKEDKNTESGSSKLPESSQTNNVSSEKNESETASTEKNESETASTDNGLAKAVSKKAKEALAQVVTNNMTEVEKAKIAYDWLFFHFKYRAMTVDLSNGYTNELTLELADYYFRYHKGSCEHYAAAQKVLLEELGFEVMYVEGERYDRGAKAWGEHVWVMMQVDGNWYHVDGLFGGNHTAALSSMFCVPDSAIENTHRWDKTKYPACTNPQILK